MIKEILAGLDALESEHREVFMGDLEDPPDPEED